MISVFFSYCHKDEGLRDQLDKHLSILKWQGVIDTWHDRQITAGSVLDTTIDENLKKSQIILLLVSSDFLASNYCYNVEMKLALQMHEDKTAVVIPVILRSCDWFTAPFGKLMAVPKDGKPVAKFPDIDDAFLEITTEIKRVASKYFSQDAIPGNTIPVIMPTKDNSSPARSSNLRVKKAFSDHEKDSFLDDAFDYIANYFEQSLKELKKRNPQIDSRFKRVDSQTFHSSIYDKGKLESECMVFFGGMHGVKSISYSRHISTSKNSLNESLSVFDDGYMLFLKSLGMGSFGMGNPKPLTFEGAAETYWQIFIQPLQ